MMPTCSVCGSNRSRASPHPRRTTRADVSGGGLVDLHTHSTASDGSRAPADVVRTARSIGLSALALTDHDTIAGLAEAAEVGDAEGVRIVPGVELSAVEGNDETHLLGLHLRDTMVLEAGLDELRAMRRTRGEIGRASCRERV